jgi:hypothetical protein
MTIEDYEPANGDVFQCAEHGHTYYDGDQGIGDPYEDGRHDGQHHEHDDGVADWDPRERAAYERGFAEGSQARVTDVVDEWVPWEGKQIVALSTLQFAWGGVFDAKPADDLIHLVRCSRIGTPGPTLCGIDRFTKGGPGWSVGGGVTGPNIKHTACGACVAVASSEYPGLSITGSVGASVMRAVLRPKSERKEQR